MKLPQAGYRIDSAELSEKTGYRLEGGCVPLALLALGEQTSGETLDSAAVRGMRG